MTQAIEDYALISNLRCAALVGRNGSIDWFCPPRFDAPACFAALVGNAGLEHGLDHGYEHGYEHGHGHWKLAPVEPVQKVLRYYQPETLVLCTEFTTASGCLRLTDCMPLQDATVVLRRLEVVSGQMDIEMCLLPRFGYGAHSARYEQTDLGPGAWGDGEWLLLQSDQPTEIHDGRITARVCLSAGASRWFQLSYLQKQQPPLPADDSVRLIDECARDWHSWADRCSYHGHWRNVVLRSLITLKALTYAPSGGMVAAPTTSLPEVIGKGANWDYRFCWIRDAVLALDILLDSGYVDETRAWCDWLLRMLKNTEGELSVLYDIDGKTPPGETELDWLPGHRQSRPVRCGNAASNQHQLDLHGQLMDLLHLARRSGLKMDVEAWRHQRKLVDELVQYWREPDEGIWELRGPRKHYTHSKIYAWVAFDRSIRDAEECGLDAPLDLWRLTRDQIHADVCQHGIDVTRGAFQQSYEEAKPDASLLMIPLLGFLPIDDPRVQATIAWVEQALYRDGLVYRFDPDEAYAGTEGAFLACGFWLVDSWAMSGRKQEAQVLFERLLALRNDVGLLAEQYDPAQGLLGNFPQALSHLALVKSAYLLEACNGAHAGEGPERHSYLPVEPD